MQRHATLPEQSTAFLKAGDFTSLPNAAYVYQKAKSKHFTKFTKGARSTTGFCDYMCSAPIVVQVLEGEDAIQKTRSIMGTTDPASADEGTIRKTFGLNVQQNSVHGSDSPEHADTEIRFFFSDCEIVG